MDGDNIIHGYGIIVIHGFGADMLSPACVEVTTGSLQPVRIKADGCFAPVNNFQVVGREKLMFREQSVPERTSSTRVRLVERLDRSCAEKRRICVYSVRSYLGDVAIAEDELDRLKQMSLHCAFCVTPPPTHINVESIACYSC